MLDFYLLPNDQPKPAYAEQAGLEFAGGLEYSNFIHLQQKGIIDLQFDYYSDFRWNSANITQMQEKTKQQHLQDDTDIKKLSTILQLAQTHQTGLVAYAD